MKRGVRAERRVANYYRLRGYRIIERNVFAGGYELDLVVRRGSHLVFCEVKEKTGDRYGTPFEMVDREKRRRIRRAAESWLGRNAWARTLSVRFEVAAVRGRTIRRVVDDLDH